MRYFLRMRSKATARVSKETSHAFTQAAVQLSCRFKLFIVKFINKILYDCILIQNSEHSLQ